MFKKNFYFVCFYFIYHNERVYATSVDEFTFEPDSGFLEPFDDGGNSYLGTLTVSNSYFVETEDGSEYYEFDYKDDGTGAVIGSAFAVIVGIEISHLADEDNNILVIVDKNIELINRGTTLFPNWGHQIDYLSIGDPNGDIEIIDYWQPVMC